MGLCPRVAALAVITFFGCVGLSRSINEATELDEFQFAISADRGTGDSVYVLRRAMNGQPGWIEVFNGSQRVYLLERCEIEDCRRTAVCGLTVPVIENLTSSQSSGAITFEWDRSTSELDATLGCEIRTRVEADNLLARFCYALTAVFEGERDAQGSGSGSLIDPICVEREFSFSEESLVLRVGPDGSPHFDG
jgi:hypothetical protein